MWESRSGQRAVELTVPSLAPYVRRSLDPAEHQFARTGGEFLVACRLPAHQTVAVDPETMEELLADVVASVSRDEVLVDLGGRSAGVLSLHEANGEGMNVAIGEQLLAGVIQPEGPDGRAVLSMPHARSRQQ